MKCFATLFSAFCLSAPVFGQTLLSQAPADTEPRNYLAAVKPYNGSTTGAAALKADEVLDNQLKQVQVYRLKKNHVQAERLLGEIISTYGKNLTSEYYQCYLYYAQALAQNGKFKESQQAYDQYSALTANTRREQSYTALHHQDDPHQKNEHVYRVDYLTINGTSADFSPTYFREGIVFVSGRKAGKFSKQSAPGFLNLYFLEDITTLSGGTGNKGMSMKNKKSSDRVKLTARTANDSRTVGFYDGSAYNTRMGYMENPLSESEQFSKSLNSRYHEGPATFFKDGNRIIFTRNNYNNGKSRESKDGINKLKLFTAEMVNGSWTKIQEMPFNGDEFSTGHPTLSADNTLLYFTSDRPGGLGGTDIYVSRFQNGSWSEPENLGPDINTKGNEMFPFVDERGNLYFSSDGWPGLGDLDLFYAVMETPVKVKQINNLGAPLNSSKDDFGILTDGERSSGYFSSNRRNGGIDDDIYSFKRETPLYACRNLTVNVLDAVTRQPLKNALVLIENKNTAKGPSEIKTDSTGALNLCLDVENEFMFVASSQDYVSNAIGFATTNFSDTRPSRLEIPLTRAEVAPAAETGTTVMMKGKVLSNKIKPLEGVLVTRRDDQDGTIQETETGPDGTFTFDGITGHNYTLDATIGKYGTFGKTIVNFNPETFTEINIVMFEKGDVVQIENIYYELDQWVLQPEARQELDKLAESMLKYPAMKIELSSHTDSRATTRYNKKLSDQRARTAKEYIVSKGIASKRITARGYGESQPVNHCKDGVNCTDQEYQQNRRTEVKIVTLQ